MGSTKVTTWQTFDIGLGIIQILFQVFLTAISAPFRGSNTPKTFKRHVALATIRSAFSRLSPLQLQSIVGTTERAYTAWTKALNIPARSVDITSVQTKAFWIGEPEAEILILFYHGGGFAMPASDGHFTFINSFISACAPKSIAALVLQYDLAPGEQYPRQLIQSVELLRYAISELGRPPSQIIMVGDSTGGNLVLGVLSHLMHPHPQIQPLKLSEPLRTVLISSPVTALNTRSNLFHVNRYQDPSTAEVMELWFKNWLGSGVPDQWNEPLENKTTWWSGLDGITRDVLITVASNEAMADDIRRCANKIKSGYANLTLFETKVDFHAEPCIGPSLGMEEGEAAKMIKMYAQQRL